MATTYKATVEFRCWKEHTCAECGGAMRVLGFVPPGRHTYLDTS